MVKNVFQLSKLANVSPPVANSWVNAMESSGYLKRIGRKKLIPLRLNALHRGVGEANTDLATTVSSHIDQFILFLRLINTLMIF